MSARTQRIKRGFIFLTFWICASLIFLGSYRMLPTVSVRVKTVKTRHFSNSTDSDECRAFNYNPFDPSIAKHFWKEDTVNCIKSVPNLLFVENNTYLKINWTKARSFEKTLDYCKYATLRRFDDFHNVVSPWSKTFTESITIPDHAEHIWGQCFKSNAVISHGYFSIIRKNSHKEALHEKNYKNHIDKNKPKETLSVLMMGIDGTSKNNMARTLGKTKKYILDVMGALELYKINKVGLNTFPNVVPLLTGHSEEEVRKSWTDQEYIDKFNHLFLLDEARRAGYRTSVILDMVKITAFHYLKKGWKNPKFDFYHRPVVINTKNDRISRRASSYCIGDKPEISHLYNYWHQLTAVFNNTKTTPYFGYSFFARLTHDFINRASRGDDLYLKVFQKLVQQKSLNNTLVVFFSDHGCRYGKFRFTYRGMLEDNNPFMFFIFPPWFKSKYPKIMANFYKNQHRLLTNFDIHATLQDILNFQGDDIATRKINTTRGVSLFQKLPEKRNCVEAGIPIKFCYCRNDTGVSVDLDLSTKISMNFLKHVIDKTNTLRDKCVVLKLNTTITVLSIVTTSKVNNFYHATIMTSPGGAVFEARLKSPIGSNNPIVTGDVGRINMYRGQASCISDARIRPFCYCKKLL